MKSIDIFIKTYRDDYGWLEYCLWSIAKNVTGYRDVVIVTDKGDGAGAREVVAISGLKNVKVLEANRAQNNQIRRCGVSQSGYRWQMVVKLMWPMWSDADAVFQVDSDCIFTKPFNVGEGWFVDGKPVWLRKEWKDASVDEVKAWGPGRHFFTRGELSEWNWMVAPGFLMTRAMTEGFRKYVSCAFGLGLDELLMGGNGIVTLPIMSEYNLFGLYLEKLGEQESGYRFIHVKEWDTETILQSWSWGGVEKSKAKMEAILGKK